jgi:hypothetical protein
LKRFVTSPVYLIGLGKGIKKVYMVMSGHQNAGHSHDIKAANKSFEDVAKFTYLVMGGTNQS